MKTDLVVESACLDEMGDLKVSVSGYEFWAGEKYTILELGWAVYYTVEDVELPDDWVANYGEVRPCDREWNEFASDNESLTTSHPVLVALSLQAWWHRNGKRISTAPHVEVPSFEEAVEIVRNRPIINSDSEHHAGTVPGLARWGRNGSS
jgi:hypothetical protein